MDITTLKTIQLNFLKELKDAYAGKKTSLPFIVHQIPSSSLVKDGQVFEVMVIGGTTWKKAICQKAKTGIEIVKEETERSIDFKNEKDFLEFIDSELYKNSRVLAINLAYPLAPVFENNRLDGVLLAVSRDSFHGLVGKKIGLEIEKYILKKRKKKMKVSVANDTVCLLLSGLIKYPWDVLGGGVDGTGVNFAFFLREESVVNLESANFNKFPQSQEGKIIDKQSAYVGRALFEKETAGGHLYKHFNLKILEKHIDFPQIYSTEELNSISLKNISQVSKIAQDLLIRSAQLVACQIAGIIELKKGRHSGDPSADGDSRISNHDERFWTSQNDKKDEGMVFNMEGSLFWKGNHYRETVEQTVKTLVPKYNVKFVEIENSAILGAAKLVS